MASSCLRNPLSCFPSHTFLLINTPTTTRLRPRQMASFICCPRLQLQAAHLMQQERQCVNWHRPFCYPKHRAKVRHSIDKRERGYTCLRFQARSMEGEKKEVVVAMEEVKGKETKQEEVPADVSLKELSKKLDDFAKERDWEQHHSPRNLLLAMVGEVGELSELFMWKGEVPRGLPGWDESEKEHLGEELSDVLLYLIRLSDMCGVDLGDAATKKIVKNAVKYPAPSKSA